ncbi:MAG: hypothetical protein EP347_08335 [Alphaproteobacteria bacterium]|nr:MAG: hypothetical protein EP347_08335 [Alphaproteobacteria bacterium]
MYSIPFRHLFIAAAVSILSLGSLSCDTRAPGNEVVVTVRPLYGLTAALMEGAATPHLLERGTDPHQTVLRPSEARRLAGAGLVIWLGPEFEPGLAKVIEPSHSFALAQVPDLDLLPARLGDVAPKPQVDTRSLDPHIWLSIERMRRLIIHLADDLASRDPAHAALYQRNRAALERDLADLSQSLAARMALLAQTPFVVHHDAYQYFENDYGLTPPTVLEGSDHLPVSARHMAEVYREVEKASPACLLVETGQPGKLALKFTGDTGVRMVVADPLARDIPPGPDLYQAALENIASAFETCLKP